jgi:hypothetical protein
MKSTNIGESHDLSRGGEMSMSQKHRWRSHWFRSVDLRKLICAAVVAAATGIGCTSPSDEAGQEAEQATPAASQIEAQPGALDLPDELQVTPQVSGCFLPDVCKTLAVCRRLGSPTGLPGCATGLVCCEPVR